MSKRRSIQASTFAIACNGMVRGGPAPALEQFLVSQRCRRLIAMYHPLTPDDPGKHDVLIYEDGKLVSSHTYRAPSRPPVTYPLDWLFPVFPPHVDCWIGFNPWACVRGIASRRLGRADSAVYWCIDYSENRFGRSPLTTIYEWVDGFCCRHADLRIDVSEQAAHARNARHKNHNLAPTQVLGMGAWLDRVPSTSPEEYRRRKVLYLGNLVRTQGGSTLIDALALLARRGVDFSADIVGRGPLEQELKEQARVSGIWDKIVFHGFIEKDEEVERILASASIGVAPYDSEIETFTRWADPAKLKSYLAAGLPIVVTDVPPNARRLEQAGAAEIVKFDPQAIADAIARLLDSPEEWKRKRAAALELRKEFDWNVMIPQALGWLGFD